MFFRIFQDSFSFVMNKESTKKFLLFFAIFLLLKILRITVAILLVTVK